MRYLLIVILFFLPIASHATTTISAQVVRNQSGSGTCLISNGFPFPPGLVTEKAITDGTIKVLVNGSEIAVNISALRGRHPDGTLRSALIQFTISMKQGDVLPAKIIIGDGPRSFSDPTYIRPTYAIVTNNNVILPSDPDYITSTKITFRTLLPAGKGTAAEEKQYTTLAKYEFDYLSANNIGGTAQYENVEGMLGLWARTGDIRFWNYVVPYAFSWLKDFTPGSAAGPPCHADTFVNPDGRTPTNNTACGLASEWNAPRLLSFASMYLMTGYRDYWSAVAYFVQSEQSAVTDQTTADNLIITKGAYDIPRYNYSTKYAALLAAMMIDATLDIPGQYYSHRVMNLSDQATWTLQAIIDSKWDLKWIPFNSGSGVVPADGTTITQGVTTATLLGVYPTGTIDPKRHPGQSMPPTGYLQIRASTLSGDFSAGSITGIGADATGPSTSDYRNGISGFRSDSARSPNINQITASISGTTMTVTVGSGIIPGNYMTGGGILSDTFIISQLNGTTGGVGDYQISTPLTISSETITVSTVIPTFQLNFTNNFLIDYYLNITSDSRIPGLVQHNVNAFLENVRLMTADDYYYQRGGTWGTVLYGDPYTLENPPNMVSVTPYDLPEYARSLVFLIKTVGDQTVNGKTYSQWYAITVDTANNSPIGVLSWSWKNFGQFYGWGMDAPWIMAQTSLPVPLLRKPTYYSNIPGDKPDLARTSR